MEAVSFKYTRHISGGSRGGAAGARPPKGPDSFVLTYKFFETEPPRELAPPYEVGAPPAGNPGSAAAYAMMVRLLEFKSKYMS